MYEKYDSYFGLHDHEHTHEPFASVSVLPKEKFLENGLYENHLRIYIKLKVREQTGLSFDEYLSRPRYEINSINRILNQEALRHNKRVEQESKDVAKKMREETKRVKLNA